MVRALLSPRRFERLDANRGDRYLGDLRASYRLETVQGEARSSILHGSRRRTTLKTWRPPNRADVGRRGLRPTLFVTLRTDVRQSSHGSTPGAVQEYLASVHVEWSPDDGPDVDLAALSTLAHVDAATYLPELEPAAPGDADHAGRQRSTGDRGSTV